jgi:MoxR-like ATPase
VITGEQIQKMQQLVLQVPAAGYVVKYAAKIVRFTRPTPTPGDTTPVPDFVKKYVSWGAGPRAGQSLVLAAKARALLHGRTYVSGEDIRHVAAPVLRHRVITNYNAEADGVDSDEIVKRILAAVPREGDKG